MWWQGLDGAVGWVAVRWLERAQGVTGGGRGQALDAHKQLGGSTRLLQWGGAGGPLGTVDRAEMAQCP